MLKRPSLGEAATLGTLYDARTDQFLVNILREPCDEAISKVDMPNTEVKYSRLDTYTEKFRDWDISAQLSASFLAGLVSVDGSGRYLTKERESNQVVQGSLMYNVTTVSETLNFQANQVKDSLALDTLNVAQATHVVSEIVWGSRNIVTFKHEYSQKGDEAEVNAQGKLEAQISILKLKIGGGGTFADSSKALELNSSFDVTIFGDVLASDGLVPTDVPGALQFLSNVQKYIASANDGKGKPLSYTLIPISLLCKMLRCRIAHEVTMKQLSNECAQKFVEAFDEIARVRRDLRDYHSLLQENKAYVPRDHIVRVRSGIAEARRIETELQSTYAIVLKDVRCGKKDETALWGVLSDFNRVDSAFHKLGAEASEPLKEKVQFLQKLVAKGAKYIGFNGENLKDELSSLIDTDIYVFKFNEKTRRTSPSWSQNVILLQQLLRDEDQGRVLLWDVDSVEGETLSGPQLSQIRNAKVVVKDLVESRKTGSVIKCSMQYDDEHLQRGEFRQPQYPILTRIPCPGPDCSTDFKSWGCEKCGALFEYFDQFIYCACGRCDYRYWDFKCCKQKTESSLTKYDSAKFLTLLGNLQPNSFNILILGKNGTPKDIWMAAFLNYLEFDSLDAARTSGKFGNESISENRVLIGNRVIQLMDTRTIGDFEDPNRDKEALAKSLSLLRDYKQIHGIVILLAPDGERLDPQFQRCIKELLTYLDRDVSRIVTFVVTSKFKVTTGGTPGNTVKAFRDLLLQLDHVDISLYEKNVYCFDLEGFRYLAMETLGAPLPDLSDSRQSWDRGVAESLRLIAHFAQSRAHQLTSTPVENGKTHGISNKDITENGKTHGMSNKVTKSSKDIQKKLRVCERVARMDIVHHDQPTRSVWLWVCRFFFGFTSFLGALRFGRLQLGSEGK